MVYGEPTDSLSRSTLHIRRILQAISLNAPSYVELSDFYKYYHHSYALDGVMIVFCTLKFFKFFRLNFRLNSIPLTLQYAFPLLLAFCTLFVILLVGFQIFAMQTFGAELRNYASTFLAMRTLLSMLLGKLDYTELEEVHGAFAPLFIFTYMLVMFFVMVSDICHIGHPHTLHLHLIPNAHDIPIDKRLPRHHQRCIRLNKG